MHWCGEVAAPAAELEGCVLSRVLGGGSRGACSAMRDSWTVEREYACVGGVPPPPTEIPGVSPQSTQSTAARMRLLQEVLELLPESGRQAALRQPSRLVDKIRLRAASTASASSPSILG